MIREMRDSGMKITEIAKDLGMSRPTVRKYLRCNIEKTNQNSFFSLVDYHNNLFTTMISLSPSTS